METQHAISQDRLSKLTQDKHAIYGEEGSAKVLPTTFASVDPVSRNRNMLEPVVRVHTRLGDFA